MADLYPVFLSLSGRRCLVAGLGKVGLRKLEGLLRCDPASVLALEKRPLEEFPPAARELLSAPGVIFRQGALDPADLGDMALVFAATDDPVENRRIARLCAENNILCDTITDPANGNFISPAVARCGGLAAAISTCGQSPYLARKWRMELENWLKPRYRLARLLGLLRPLVIATGTSHAVNASIFRRIADSGVGEWLENNQPGKCLEWLKNELPELDAAALAAIVQACDAPDSRRRDA